MVCIGVDWKDLRDSHLDLEALLPKDHALMEELLPTFADNPNRSELKMGYGMALIFLFTSLSVVMLVNINVSFFRRSDEK
jgi:hypothetical protein